MKHTASFLVVLALAAPAARAQDVQQPPAAPPAPAAPLAAPAQMPPSSPAAMSQEKLERIYHIRQLEGMLTNAVKAGATSLAMQLQAEPNSLFVTNNARARGHELEDYGVFFDVDVPTIMPSVLWAMQTRPQQLRDYYALREVAGDPKANDGMRRMAQMEARRLERILGLPPSQTPLTDPGVQPPARGLVVAQDVPVDSRDPNELYTDAIKSKLIDAMLSYGFALRLDDGEWLTIAARASDATPGQLDDSASILIRIKGADLNAFMLKKITRDEVLKKIDIKIG